MRLGLEPLLPLAWLLPAGAILAGVAWWLYARWRPLVSRRYWWLLFGVKLATLLALLLLLLNPYWLERTPDTRRTRVVCLLDATGSMATRDCGGRTRLDVVKHEVANPGAAFGRLLAAKYPGASLYVFAGDRRQPLAPGAAFDVLPGDTDLALVLQRSAEAGSGAPALGAVVLVTDGGNNRGAGLLAGAAPYRQTGIPVHCVGVGDARPRPDVRVRWQQVPPQVTRGRPFVLEAAVDARGRDATDITLELLDGDRPVASKTVSLAAGTAQNLSFDLTAATAGLRTYKLRAAPVPGEENVGNNVDLAAVKVVEPDSFRLLYFSGNLDWEYKFLHLLAEAEPRLVLDAIVRSSPTAWFSRGFPEDQPVSGLPAADVLGRYDGVILNLNALNLIGDAQAEALGRFVEQRGGGLILTGAAEAFTEPLQRLLPVAAKPGPVTHVSKRPLAFRPVRVLAAGQLDSLRLLAEHLILPPDVALMPVTARDLKPGAQAVVLTTAPEYVVLATQNYGAGRVALLALTDTWEWALQPGAAAEQYGVFWSRLIAWAASTSRQRLGLRPAGTRLAVGAEVEVQADLLNAEYAPDSTAELQATLLLPDGTEERQRLVPFPRIDGRYLGKFVPRQPGEYRLKVRARLKTGEDLDAQADYLVTDTAVEREPTPLAEAPLQSLARLTGGQYWNYRQIAGIQDLPLAGGQHYRETRHEFRRSWLFLLIVGGGLLPGWFLRRRIGLR